MLESEDRRATQLPQELFARTFTKLTGDEQVTIVVLGDSNTELTWHTAGRLNWAGLLQEAFFERYGGNRVTVINAGRCGGTAIQALGRLEHDVLRFMPDLVVVSFSMNDAMRGEAGLEEFSESIQTIVRTIRERCGSDILLRTTNPIVVSNQPEWPREGWPGEEWPGMHQGIYARRLVEIAGELGCPIVDHYSLWKQAPRDRNKGQDANHLWLRMSDAIHPNALGHLYFYREMAPLFGLAPHFPWE